MARARRAGLVLDAIPTERPRHATELVAARLGPALDLVAVAGGDGTLGEVAEALLGTSVPIAILPGGDDERRRARVRSRGCRRRPRRRSSRARRARSRSFTPAGRVCLIGAGVGFDARVMAYTVPVLKRLFGRAGIGWTATLEWMKYEFPPIEVEGVDADGRPFRREATFVLSANTARYGGDPILSPHADAANDLLELVLFTSRSRKTLMLFYHHLSQREGRAPRRRGRLADGRARLHGALEGGLRARGAGGRRRRGHDARHGRPGGGSRRDPGARDEKRPTRGASSSGSGSPSRPGS